MPTKRCLCDHHLMLMKVKIGGRYKTRRKESSWQVRSKGLRMKEGKVRFWARLRHQMNKAGISLGKMLKEHGREFKGVSWSRLKLHMCGRQKY